MYQFRNKNISRFLTFFLCSLLGVFTSCGNQNEDKGKMDTAIIDPWEKADSLAKNIRVPEFPDREFNILDFGAKGDGTTKNSEAFKKAILACTEAGGGKVLVPEGDFLTGAIHLENNVNLHLEEGAQILFSTDKTNYLPVVHTSFEGVELMNYSPLIYAFGKKNIAVTGKGILNGQADNSNWWPWKGKPEYGYQEGEPEQSKQHNLPRLRKMNENGTPVSERVFGEGHQIRPNFFEAFECENVLLKGVTFKNAPFWVIHPIKSSHVTIDGVTVNSHGPNNDGCDPEYSSFVRIANCTFNTGDDCIAIKSGRNADGRRVNIPSENILVENCTMKDGHGGVVMGSEISAGVRNVYVRNCSMDSPNLDRMIRIKTNTLRGGFVKDVYVKNIEVGQVKEALLKINTHYGIYENQEGEFIPEISNIHLQDITVENAGKFAVLIEGRESAPVKNIILENVTVKKVEEISKISNAEPVKYINTTINGQKIKTE